MNKVDIEPNGDGTYKLTDPFGGYSTALSPRDVVKRLKHLEQEVRAALDDITARREQFEKKIADS